MENDMEKLLAIMASHRHALFALADTVEDFVDLTNNDFRSQFIAYLRDRAEHSAGSAAVARLLYELADDVHAECVVSTTPDTAQTRPA